jgi:SagB-type dehydrogenase family enzyme
MEPVDFTADWSDHPRRSKFYPDVERLALPAGTPSDLATVGGALFAPVDPEPAPFTLPVLADMLLYSYGQVGRRLALHSNSNVVTLPKYGAAGWSRGTASGGGLYPVSVYWVSGASGPTLPGVYHYSPTHHAMQRLLVGDVSATVAEAIGDIGPATDQYLVLGLKFWQNSFKYNSFSYHAVTMDIGTVVQTWKMWARAHGLEVSPALWFDEELLAGLLGVEAQDEGVLAVVPLRWADGAGARAVAPAAPPVPKLPEVRDVPEPRPARIRASERERSKRVVSFEAVTGMQDAAIDGARQRPAPEALKSAHIDNPHGVPELGRPVPLPPVLPMEMPLRTALSARRSSFGRFSAQRPTRTEQLGTVLAAASAAAALPCDLSTPDQGLDLAGLYVFVNHVTGVEPGVYRFDPAENQLRLIHEGSRARFLQYTYFLENYNLEQAGAVIVPTVRAAAVLDAVGARGYRLTNAVVGAIAQAVYTAAPAVGLGCGVALGFDNIAYAEELGLQDTDEVPLLIMMIGHERPMDADFRYDLV